MFINYKNLESIKKGHLSDTVDFAVALAKGLNCSKEEVEHVETAAAFHDVGKALIPEEYLNKNGALSQEERSIVDYHAQLGYEIMQALGHPIPVAVAVRDHHNPFSSSYLAQILRMADIYSAMTEVRPYKAAKTHEEAMNVLRDSNFPPEMLKVGDKILRETRIRIDKKKKNKFKFV